MPFINWLRGWSVDWSEPARRPRGVALAAAVQTIEPRQLLSATTGTPPAAPATPPPLTPPAIDGSGYNLQHPTWGAAGTDLLRIAPNGYADGISTPGGTTRPSAREISNALADQTVSMPNNRDMSSFVYAWGQFLDHDLDLTTTSSNPKDAFNIKVPKGDPQFDPNGTGTQVIPLQRSTADPATGTSPSNPRQQVNSITAWVDGSQIYGSDTARTNALRTFSGGHLKMSAGNLLPANTAGLANANDAHITPDNQLFLAGDIRANENVELISLQTLFVREHNRIADHIAKDHPELNDEQIFQQARMQVIGELQAITYNEFLPALLGDHPLTPYRGFNPNVNPGISNEFSTAAFRIGHTLVGDDVEFLDNNGNAIRSPADLAETFFNPNLVRQTGIDPILKYLASDNAQEVDTKIVDGLRNFLFGPPGSGGLDLASLNIQRGRDNGLADYNTTRAAFGLPKVHSFADITSNVSLQQALQKLYGTVDNIDLWVGGLAEDHLPGSSVGATFSRIIVDQFTRLRDGDPYFYLNVMHGQQLNVVQNTHLADIIRMNSNVTNLQPDVFFFHTEITGTVFADTNGNGKLDPREQGLAGRTIQLLDTQGNIVATTTTRRDGTYRFTGISLGSYQLKEVLPSDAVNTSTPTPVSLTRGMTVTNKNFGEAKKGTRTQPTPGGQFRQQSNPSQSLDGNDLII